MSHTLFGNPLIINTTNISTNTSPNTTQIQNKYNTEEQNLFQNTEEHNFFQNTIKSEYNSLSQNRKYKDRDNDNGDRGISLSRGTSPQEAQHMGPSTGGLAWGPKSPSI